VSGLTRVRAQRTIERGKEGAINEYLAFRVASTTYALPVVIIREIVRTAQITPVPRAPTSVMGVTSFRGQVVTVVDMARRLSLACSIFPETSHRVGGARVRILMADINGEIVGLVVDEVLTVYRLSARDIERATTTVGTDAEANIVGIARIPESDEILLLLEGKALVP
jgi:purine-binding chemotaxis protein CheW